MGAGPTLGPADTNGGGVDGKHLDVGDMSDVSDVSFLSENDKTIELTIVNFCRMKKICHPPMPKESGVPTSNRVFKKLSPSIHHAVDEKSFYQKRGRCMVSNCVLLLFEFGVNHQSSALHQLYLSTD